MRTIKTLLIICLVLFQASALAKSPVWKVAKDDKWLFIGGTVHLLSEQDYPLPKAFDLAFNIAEEVVFETDVDGLNSIAVQAKLLSVIMYQDERTLKTQLKPETYQALHNYFAEKQLPAAMFEKMTPAGLNLTLVTLELQKLGITGNSGVEQFFNSRAKNQQKEVNWLESIDQQAQFLNKMNTELDPDQMTLGTLRDVKLLKDEWNKLLEAWKQGDMQALEGLGINRMLSEHPEFYQFMLVDRNQAWVPKIKQMLDTPEIEFVLVGALHLAGDHSVLELLKQQGYKIEQMD